MAISVEPEAGSEGADDTLSGLHDAFGALAEGLANETDDDSSLEADLTEDGTEEVEAQPESEPESAPESETVPEVVAEADPLATARPLDYTVDGTQKSYDGIKVLSNPDGSLQGAIIQPDALKDVQYRLQRGEYLETQNKTLYGQVQNLDRFTFKAPDGVEHRGLAAVDAQAIEHAKLVAAAKIMAEVIENPDKLISLALATQSGDQSEIQRLTREISIAAKEAQWNTREQRGQMVQKATQEEQQAQHRTQVTQQALERGIELQAQQFPALTADDRQKAVQYLSKFSQTIIRPATPDEAKVAGVNAGELIIDYPVIYEYLADRNALRAQTQTTVQSAATKATQAAKENAQRLAAASKGKPSSQKRGAVPTKGRAKATEDEGESWSEQRARMMRGEFTSSSDDD